MVCANFFKGRCHSIGCFDLLLKNDLILSMGVGDQGDDREATDRGVSFYCLATLHLILPIRSGYNSCRIVESTFCRANFARKALMVIGITADYSVVKFCMGIFCRYQIGQPRRCLRDRCGARPECPERPAVSPTPSAMVVLPPSFATSGRFRGGTQGAGSDRETRPKVRVGVFALLYVDHIWSAIKRHWWQTGAS
jgi:hypothetical protein